MTILIAGGTGLVGQHLAEILDKDGHTVHILTRQVRANKARIKYFRWIINESIDEKVFFDNSGCQVDAIINLTGAGIVDKRWTKSRQEEIINSRIKPAEYLQESLKKLNLNIPVYISASGVNYYNNSQSKLYVETDKVGTGFVQHTCEKWEQQAFKMSNVAQRIITMRTGVVLAEKSSFLQKFTATVPLFTAVFFGTGNQFLSWIHIEDLCQFYIHAIKNNKMEGAYNIAICEHATHLSFLKSFKMVSKKKFLIIKAPQFITKLVFGKLAVLLTEGVAVSNEKVKNTGFKFKYKTVEKAVEDLS